MDLLSRRDVERLSESRGKDVHVSLFMPTHRFGSGIEADKIRWKNIITGVQSLFAGNGMPQQAVDQLLEPAWAVERDALGWQYMSDRLAMFLHGSEAEMYRVPVNVPSVAAVGERFLLGPLLRILSGDEHFLLLALSQRRIRLLEGSRHRVEEVIFPDVPTDLRDVVAPPEPRSDTMAYPTGTGRGAPAIFYGHGAADDQFKSDEIERFLRAVAAGLDSYLKAQDLPVVLVGLDSLVSTYRDVNTYSALSETAVIRNPDELSADELHDIAWPVIAGRLQEDRQREVEHFQQLNGTGRASTDPVTIEKAAAEGRVESLFLAADPTCWEKASRVHAVVLELGSQEAFAHCELLDRATIDTLTRGGHVYGLPDSSVPGQGDVAAVFRY